MLSDEDVIAFVGTFMVLGVFVLTVLERVGRITTEEGLRLILFAVGFVIILWFFYLVFKSIRR